MIEPIVEIKESGTFILALLPIFDENRILY